VGGRVRLLTHQLVQILRKSNPKDLGPAIKRAIDVVKRGEPALVDVLTQPR